ncbi:phage holin family protein [Pedobacter insulae]|uniref:Putative Holin-X, holin superfamily III n=1 Tax=Pedobacter insulae TaxID=414048 RepID=A0A1I2XHH3_9SPHI|nr:phage holin family protein [Pedobacter insulae]SFH12862.1 Putative Holin-X, holin superfamily III [Pedobacter insulae]
MEENKEKGIADIFSDAKDYIDTRIEYTKLTAVEKGSKLIADLITSGAVVIGFMLAFLFGTFTLALFLSDILGTYTRGFGCVAGIYFIMSIIIYLIKDKYLEPGLVNLFIAKYFDKLADKDDDDEDK